jgi:hypothetical protein
VSEVVCNAENLMGKGIIGEIMLKVQVMERRVNATIRTGPMVSKPGPPSGP